MILITGASGHLGSAVVAQLRKNTGEDRFVVSSSNVEGVAKLQKEGLRAILADFNDPQTLKQAFRGIDTLLLISTMDPNRLRQHKHVVDMAKAQGVKHIVYTGLAIVDIQTSAVRDLMMSHFQTEDYIKESGLTYTILRNTMYADALSQILGPDGLTPHICLPAGKGSVPYVLRREMGEAIANLLTQTGHENKTYQIVGPKSYGFKDIAKALKAITGKEIGYSDISEENFVAILKNNRFSDFSIYLHAGTIRDIKMSQYEIESNTLESLLGRPAATLNELLIEVFRLNYFRSFK